MDLNYLIGMILTLTVGVIGYFLKRVMTQIDEMNDKLTLNKENVAENKSKIEILDIQSTSKFQHFNEKFDMLFTSLRDLTLEIKELNTTMKNKH